MLVKDSWREKGYVDEPVPSDVDLKSEIRRMCKEKNAVILAHYYTDGEVQDIADFVGDSLALAQWSAKTDADIIVVLIPINMRDGSVLAVGKGNPDWNYSAPHGAGRHRRTAFRRARPQRRLLTGGQL